MLSRILGFPARFKAKYAELRADADASTVIPLHSKRMQRANRASFGLGLLREVPAIFTVFAAGASALQGEHEGAGLALAAAELIAGAFVLISIALEARHLFARQAEHGHAAPHTPPKVNKSNLAAAALGYVEAWHRTHVTGHFKLVSPQVLGATLSLLAAFFQSRLSANRRQRMQPHVAISPNGIRYRENPRRRWRAAWTDVAAVEHDHGELAVLLHNGRRHVLRADDHHNGHGAISDARAAIEAHAPHLLPR